MIVEPAKIIAIDAENIWVDVVQKSSCGSCKAKSACGHGIANELSSQSKNVCMSVALDATDNKAYKVGDTVNIAIHETGLLISAGLMYFFPILSLLIFSAVAAQFTGQQWLVACIGFLGLLASFALVKYYLADLINARFRPFIHSSVSQSSVSIEPIQLEP